MLLLEKDTFGITSHRENGILKPDTKDKANICNKSNQPSHVIEADSKLA